MSLGYSRSTAPHNDVSLQFMEGIEISMYIGLGTVVLILVIIVIVLLVRR